LLESSSNCAACCGTNALNLGNPSFDNADAFGGFAEIESRAVQIASTAFQNIGSRWCRLCHAASHFLK
jgi:hypothetical protein